MATSTLQRPSMSLLSLFCSANFDKERIVIADNDLSDEFLTLYLEDAREPVATLDEAVIIQLPISQFAKIIEANELNSYAGTKYSESGRPYEARIIINEPIAWYEQDATTFQRRDTLDIVKATILKLSLSC